MWTTCFLITDRFTIQFSLHRFLRTNALDSKTIIKKKKIEKWSISKGEETNIFAVNYTQTEQPLIPLSQFSLETPRLKESGNLRLHFNLLSDTFHNSLFSQRKSPAHHSLKRSVIVHFSTQSKPFKYLKLSTSVNELNTFSFSLQSLGCLGTIITCTTFEHEQGSYSLWQHLLLVP